MKIGTIVTIGALGALVLLVVIIVIIFFWQRHSLPLDVHRSLNMWLNWKKFNLITAMMALVRRGHV